MIFGQENTYEIVKNDLNFYFKQLFFYIEKEKNSQKNSQKKLFYFLLQKYLYQNLKIYSTIIKNNNLLYMNTDQSIKKILQNLIISDYEENFSISKFILFFLTCAVNDIIESEYFEEKTTNRFIKNLSSYLNSFFQEYFKINFFESSDGFKKTIASFHESYYFQNFEDIKEKYMFFLSFISQEKKLINDKKYLEIIKNNLYERSLIEVENYVDQLFDQIEYILTIRPDKVMIYFFYSLGKILESLEDIHGKDKLKNNIFLTREAFFHDLLMEFLFDNFLLYEFEIIRIFKKGNYSPLLKKKISLN